MTTQLSDTQRRPPTCDPQARIAEIHEELNQLHACRELSAEQMDEREAALLMEWKQLKATIRRRDQAR